MIFELRMACRTFDGMQQTKSPAEQRLNHTLAGQRVVLIGGTSGFGFATAKAAASEGAAVIVASSNKTKVDQAVSQLPAGTEGQVLDITREASVAAFFAKIGAFDYLAITAGESLKLDEFAALNLEEARRFFETRFWGALTVAKYASQQIKTSGSIILTNGMIGLRPQTGWLMAAGVCGAVEALTRALAIELRPSGSIWFAQGLFALSYGGTCRSPSGMRSLKKPVKCCRSAESARSMISPRLIFI
jgi:NAD(P)-dependent dehydrogenase (short-subunit alcohol dehydrogenase family)